MDDGLSEAARRLIAIAMAQDEPGPGAEEQSWGMVISRVGTGPSDAGDVALDVTAAASVEPEISASAPRVGERIGRFIVIDVLGKGAMGVVVRAFDPRLERTLAIKVVGARHTERAERARARLVAEARALARLSHPNVVAVYEVDVHDGRDYVAMELVDGVDLQRWLRAEPRSWQEIVRVFAAAADGLHAVHQAGLLHRDIKPANILMGNDGRVRVGDFGIATRDAASTEGPMHALTAAQAGDVDGTGTPASDVTALTDDGEVVGTPAYMAPEQHVGAALTAAADQYAFCVSLFEALWGERPFAVPMLLLALAKSTPPVRPPPVRPSPGSVPMWLFRVVARGLAPDPAQRHASMAALATALRKDAGRRRRRIAFVATTLAGIGAGALLTAGPGPCDGAAAKLEGIWDLPTRDAVEQAFTASERPYAVAAWTQIAAQLDGYAGAWTAMHTDACMATRVRAEQSEALLDRRMLCLEIRREGLAATVQLLRTGDADTIDHAFAMVGRLRAVALCGDAEVLAAQVAPPDDPEVRAHVETTRTEVARARASYDAGRYDEAMELADAATATATAIGYEPLLAEAQFVRGTVLQTRGRHDESRTALHLAAWTALGVGHDSIAVEAAASAVWLEAEYLRDFDAAAQWVEILRATLRRSGSPPSVAARVGNVIGVSLADAGRYDDAIAEYEHALSLVVDDPAEAYTVHGLRINIANVYLSRGDGARAREIYAAELVGFEALLGPDHPRVNLLRRMLADALGDAGEHARALTLLEGVVASMARIYGEGASELGSAHMSLATAYLRMDRRNEARALYEQARDTFTEAGDRVSLALVLGNLGSLQVELGDHTAAIESLDGALAIQREIYGGDHGDMVYPLVDQAGIAIAAGRLADAEALAIEAERIATALLDPLAHERIIAMQTRETALAAQGRIAEALPLARETLALAERSEDIRPGTRPIVRAHLGMLLAQTGAHAEALAVLERAAVELTELGDGREALEVRLARAGALAALGRRDEAREGADEGMQEARREGWEDLVGRGQTLLDGLD